jgi:IS66 C-terminal element
MIERRIVGSQAMRPQRSGSPTRPIAKASIRCITREPSKVSWIGSHFLFAGSDAGGKRAAAIYGLIETAQLSGLDPEACLRYVLTHIDEQPINQVAELLPGRITDKLTAMYSEQPAAISLAA